MSFDRYGIYAARIGDILLRDLSDISWRSASKKSVVIPGGDVHPRAIVNCCADPVMDFSTKALDALFAGAATVDPWIGYAVNTAGSPSTPSALLQFQKRVDGSTFASGANHIVGTNTKGFLNPVSISAQQDDEAGVKCMLSYSILSTDGMTPPMTWSNAAALTSVPNFDGIWFLGPATIGVVGSAGIFLGSLQSMELRFGINYRSPRGDGNVYPVNGSVHSVVPEIRFTLLNFQTDVFAMAYPWGSAYSQVGECAFQFYLQKGVHGGARVSSDVAEHIAIITHTGERTPETCSVREIDDAQVEIVLRPTGGIFIAVQQTISF